MFIELYYYTALGKDYALMLPQGLELHRSVSMYSIRTFLTHAATQRDQITCFRCGEQGHVKAECMMWKIRLCTNVECVKSSECSFAHGEKELRTPWTPKCIRITKRDGMLIVLGCGSLNHTYRNCNKF